MSRRVLTSLLALAVVLAAWAVWKHVDDSTPLSGADRERRKTDRALLSTDGRPRRASDPALSGRGEAAEESGGEEQEVERRDVEVHVVSRFGDTLPSVPLHVFHPGAERPTLVYTDATGRATVPDIPLDGSVRVQALTLGYGRPQLKTLAAAIREFSTHLVAEHAILLELDARDAETGKRVPGVRWRFSNQGYKSPTEARGEDPLALPLETRTRALIRLQVVPPKGWVDWDGGDHWVSLVPTANRLRIVHPLRREARVLVDMKGSKYERPLSPVVLGFFLPGGPGGRHLWQAPDKNGRLRVPGVPFIRDAPIAILVGDMTHARTYRLSPQSTAAAARGEKKPSWSSATGQCVVEAHLPDSSEDECVIRGERPGLSDRENGTRFYLRGIGTTERSPAGRPDKLWSTLPSAGSTLTVRVLDHEGNPMPDVLVGAGRRRKWGAIERTNREGELRLENLPAGPCWAGIGEPGRLPISARTTLKAGESTLLTLREPVGAGLRVRVIDAEGRGVPFAVVSVEGAGPAGQVQGDVQTVNPYTDVHGNWFLRRVPAGEHTVSVSRVHKKRSADCLWSGRKDPVGGWGRGRATVTLEEGRTAEIEIVLDALK